MRDLPLIAKLFIAGVVAMAAAALAVSLIHWTPGKPLELLVLLAMTLVASRLRVKLPHINGTMSVNVPFLLLVAIRLSSAEALLIAAMASLVQSIPSANRSTTFAHSIFNAATITNAVAAAAFAFRFASYRGLASPLSIAAAGAAFFLANTIPVALVLWLAENQSPAMSWLAMARLSAPYYVLSAGVAALVNAVTQIAVWGLALALLPVMYSIYTSYRLYFSGAAAGSTQSTAAKSMEPAAVGVATSSASISIQ